MLNLFLTLSLCTTQVCGDNEVLFCVQKRDGTEQCWCKTVYTA